MDEALAPDEPLAELHAHLGGSVEAATMWELAAEQGIKVPYRDYWEFAAATNVGEGTDGLTGLDTIYHLTELIQSSPEGVFRSVHGMLSGGYRSQRITTHEVRFNPAKRNRSGERDLDSIVMAAAHAVDRAMLEYPIRAGLILMMDRTFSFALNGAIVERAIRFQNRGVIGIDIGGPRPKGAPLPFDYLEFLPLIRRARDAGLGVTFHAGEEGLNAADPWPYLHELAQVVDLGVDRIGHGIIASLDPNLMRRIAQLDVVLEVCPTSNIRTGAVTGSAQIGSVVRTLIENGVKVIVATDGPEMIGTRLRTEFDLLVNEGAITPAEAREMNHLAHARTFINAPSWAGANREAVRQ